MAEGSREAAILIATSCQALGRAERGGRETLLADCTVLILFAGIYLEATLNYIIEQLGEERDVRHFLRSGPGREPGMEGKLKWFHNKFVAKTKVPRPGPFQRTWPGLRRKFPGFADLHRFRNDISHGSVNRLALSLSKAWAVRQHAKDIARDLYEIVEAKTGRRLRRISTYMEAIAYYQVPMGQRT